MEKEPQPRWTIREMELDDGEATHELLKRLHQDTYENSELGVRREQLAERFDRRTPEERLERLKQRLVSDDNQSYVAIVGGELVGMVAPRIDEDGTRRVGALYVDKNLQGSGLAHELMQKALDWHDAERNDVYLRVVSYNERAKAFYRKWGFVEVPDSEGLFDGLIPEVKMVRKGDKK